MRAEIKANIQVNGSVLTYLVPGNAERGDIVQCPPTFWQETGQRGVIVAIEGDPDATFYSGECRSARLTGERKSQS